ncbi:MAG: NAD(P)H-dependent oxidoreductase [Sporomusaceae bacterium]|jgi:hypothetical protein|nr:NAD(P)H-dependent oxidoreductase [Sporomusaceae bacterium]
MKITAISGSPKPKASMSGKIIANLEKILGTKIEVYQATQMIQTKTPADLAPLLRTDVLLIVFPLYVDSLPAPLLELLTRLEEAAQHSSAQPQVFAIANCGFFEPEQTALTLQMIEEFANRAGLKWGYGLGIGGGPALAGYENWEKGIAANVYRALTDLSAALKSGKSGPNVFATLKIPRFLYRLMANFGFWYSAKQSGVKNLKACPYMNN